MKINSQFTAFQNAQSLWAIQRTKVLWNLFTYHRVQHISYTLAQGRKKLIFIIQVSHREFRAIQSKQFKMTLNTYWPYLGAVHKLWFKIGSNNDRFSWIGQLMISRAEKFICQSYRAVLKFSKHRTSWDQHIFSYFSRMRTKSVLAVKDLRWKDETGIWAL
jgi:hypothetical protein